ncbi:MAG: S8 family peptidase, partial [Aquabacterium sp.]|nr:S8 family peptidase [Aquabacterium sp.]
MSLSCSPLRALLPALGSALLSALLPALPLLAAPADAAAQQARVIVKLRAHSDLLNGRAAALGTVPATGEPARMRRLGERIGVVMQDGRRISERMQVAQASGITSEALARKLSAQADVEWAAVDRRVRIAGLPPNDNLYGTDFSAPNGQWYLRAPDSTFVSATNARAAWQLTRGASNVVVAVIDTGVRFDHPDLKYKLLPGYDVISNPWIANDNTGRDPDATDVGDRLTDVEKAAHPDEFADCEVANTNSWHGTKVAGIIGAQTDNARGVAGIGWNVRILPVRALGRCGGYVSDVAAGIRWAAGLQVDDLPVNPYPARIINLSLGSDEGGDCTAQNPPADHDFRAYRDAINEVTALGAVVVVAAGNNNGAVNPPGNCSNTITVGGLRHDGTKSGFSAYGSEVTLSAPAGNCAGGSGCQYTIVTTTNAGSTSPVVGVDAYTSASNYAAGTSFSAPLVSGTVALMLSVRPELDYASVRSLLIGNVTPWSATFSSYANSCPSFVDDTGICRCSAGTCGAGMLNTQAAVTAALGIDFSGEAQAGQPAPGDVLTLGLAAGALPSGEFAQSYQWGITEGASLLDTSGAVATAPGFTVSPLGEGRFTVRLVVVTNVTTRIFTRSIDIGPAPDLTPQPVTSESATVSRS